MRLLKGGAPIDIKATPRTFSGRWYPGMPEFLDLFDEIEWLEAYEAEHGLSEPDDIDDVIGEIAKYLPTGATPSEANLLSKAYQVAEGVLTAQDAAQQLSSKKIIIKKKDIC